LNLSNHPLEAVKLSISNPRAKIFAFSRKISPLITTSAASAFDNHNARASST
jgi:hypothetical protein